jgi:hypothetical protein
MLKRVISRCALSIYIVRPTKLEGANTLKTQFPVKRFTKDVGISKYCRLLAWKIHRKLLIYDP